VVIGDWRARVLGVGRVNSPQMLGVVCNYAELCEQIFKSNYMSIINKKLIIQ
jgi:hypothetical protein